ncbi:excinuclease ABC subunit A [Paenibacillus cellulosilyticus]|uniref:UvrABC system protein A n=1 Tax=Paenibacillus cellulosilyticus TaxID=375489 RepID=A0A2V2YLX2_9BACL|nr:excinuclease ABC subunit UvrA [Paenibacillus cellulosilyticus]PWV95240.1 excinuclease ABC subunit A [Paenibacillus cellulosilyticus]QKS46014.1 excinuclease ABC subunit UvrA [Paenibacillus cellulosilyticus]
MHKSISIKGARQNNLKNISVDIPRDQITVITGVSGSGKSTLAFDVIYGEGQRRFLESLSSSYAKRYIPQLKKPDIDYITGLSPVVSIEQKTGTPNPRSTVGTMSDIYDYVRLLFATVGTPHCPHCREALAVKTPAQIAEHIVTKLEGKLVEIYAPVTKLYGEDYSVLFDEIREKGYRLYRIDGVIHDASNNIELDEHTEYEMKVLVDKFLVSREIYKSLVRSVEEGLKIGEGFLHIAVDREELEEDEGEAFYRDFGCEQHQLVVGELLPHYFSFNDADSACRTCLGLGVYKYAKPELMIDYPDRSIRRGALSERIYKMNNPKAWRNMVIYSMAQHFGVDLDVSLREMSKRDYDLLFHGTKGERFPFLGTETNDQAPWIQQHVGKMFTFDGIVGDIDRWYRNSRKKQDVKGYEESMFKKVMVEHTCPECSGTKLKPERLLVTIGGMTVHEACTMPIDELLPRLHSLVIPERLQSVGVPILHELAGRIKLLIDIGIGYLSLNRRSDSISGGEAQRIRLSTQIGSGLMGMLYVLDEPSIGLHPRDGRKVIETLKKLRDTGNTVIVVEHDVETIAEADHVIEIGPGPGIHGGNIVAQGTIKDLRKHPDSLTGQYLSGRRTIPLPAKRRQPDGRVLRIVGARENTLRNIDVDIPLGMFVCATGVSGSGKSSLINQVLYKKLANLFQDVRIIPGAHDSLEGYELLSNVISIDQSPIGRMPTSNPATYVGLFDRIRTLYASLPESVERGYTETQFSFNAKGGRCEECKGFGTITTALQFMPDVETVCPSCKGARYTSETLEIKYRDKTINDILSMSIEDAEPFFQDEKLVAHKLNILNQLGLGYLQLGQSATIMSGGEAQRIKLAAELGKIKRGAHNLYILDEPTTGLHLADIQKLLDCLNRLVDAGHTVLVIEHNLDVIKVADHIIDLGPEAGRGGGLVVAQGTPEQVMAESASHTGACLKAYLQERGELHEVPVG